MKKDRCAGCGYVYDPVQGDLERGIAPGTPFEPADELALSGLPCTTGRLRARRRMTQTTLQAGNC